VTEQAVCFPNARPSLVGVITESGKRSNPQKPTLVFLNAGLLHRVGPNRLYVRLAREAARRGLNSLRFDLSGIGDSLPRTDSLPLRAAALSDVHDALDFLSTAMCASSFVLLGLCSGADLAFRTAVADTRVVGVVLIDGLPYRTIRSRATDHLHRLTRGLMRVKWRSVFAANGPVWRRLHSLTGSNARPRDLGAGATTQTAGRDTPPRAEAEAALQELVGRGVRLMVVYTEGRGYNYRRQFADLFPAVSADKVMVKYFEGTDHTFNLLASQDRLARAVDQWIAQF
jgi:hypothetical protein